MTWHAIVAAAALVAAAPGAAAQGALWVVDDDGGPGTHFTAIQPAIDAAADGDIVLVRDGLYASFTIDARSLAVIGEDGGDVQVSLGTVAVRNVGATQSVLLRGIDRVATGFAWQAPTFEHCAGPVWVEDCWFSTNNLGSGGLQPDAIVVTDCASIVFTRCLTTASPKFGKSGSGLLATDSSVAAFDTPLVGREGSVGAAPHDGGDGVSQTGGFLFVSGCTLSGGAGGKGVVVTTPGGSFCTDGGNGGDGLALAGEAPLAVALEAGFAAGAAALAAPPCASGSPGQAVAIASGHVAELPGLARSALLDATACEGGAVALALHGAASEPALLAVSASPGFHFAPALDGVLALGVPLSLVPVGTLSAAGELHASLSVPHLPSSAPDAQLLFVQPVFVVAPGKLALGAPSALALLKSAVCP